MWSHYSNFHKGICIDYNVFYNNEKSILYLETNDNNIELVKIGDKQYLPIFKVNYEKKIAYDFNQVTQTTEELVKLVLTKSKVWKYEKEWRSFIHNIDKEYIKLAQNTIASVIIGSKMDKKDEVLLREIVNSLNKNRTTKIKLYKSYLDEDTNKLYRKRCKI